MAANRTTFSLYIDGRRAFQMNNGGPSQDEHVAVLSNGNHNQWIGRIADAAMWSRALHPVNLNQPKAVIIATGGTIAGVAHGTQLSDGYQAGVIFIDQLLENVPDLKRIARIEAKQIVNIDSKDMTIDIWIEISKFIKQLCLREDIYAIVITHGTDTLEETAFFLQLTTNTDKPIVLTGSMRPSTSLSADGSLNLFNAVLVATNEESRGKGVLVVMNDLIYSASNTIKTNTYSVDTFDSNQAGILGRIQNGEVHYTCNIRNTNFNSTKPYFDINKLNSLPLVDIIPSYTDPSSALILGLLSKHCDGIVIAGTGNGTIHKSLELAAKEAARNGVAIVRASRVCYGRVTKDIDDDKNGFLYSGTLNPWKARVLLMIILAVGINDQAVRQRFFNYY
ncbi:unnamed protein product [Rotaria sp. Silwood1]|nr:unnamed protein product [Rotaria sp. Silwood1]